MLRKAGQELWMRFVLRDAYRLKHSSIGNPFLLGASFSAGAFVTINSAANPSSTGS